MPFRLRKSFKIAKGFKINLSKSGISTTIGGKGAAVNLSKRGTRTTLGIPGTGLSYSSTSSTSTPRVSNPKRATHSNNGAGCLTGLFTLFLLPFRVMRDLINSARNPQTRQSTFILSGAIIMYCLFCFGATSVVSTIGSGVNMSTPTVDINAMATNAMKSAWTAYTETAAAQPTDTSISSPVPALTDTLIPTLTLTISPTVPATSTPPPTFTPLVILQPSNTPYIAPTVVSGGGGTGNCHPAYPTVCIPPPPPDLDCGDIPHRRFQVLPPDPHNFDREGDGVGCEG